MNITVDCQIHIHQPDADLLAYVIEQNTFPNPAVAEAQRMGRYATHIPEFIRTFEETPDGTVIAPRGFLADLIRYRPALVRFDDWRTEAPIAIPELAGVTLRAYQAGAIDEASRYDQGVIQAPTGSGKTIIGLSLVTNKQQRALILVHSKELAQQWQSTIKDLMGIEAGIVGNGKWTEGEQVTICMLQTLAKNEDRVRAMAAQYGLVLVDEAHHIPAQTFSKVIGWMPCKYRYGLTATPYRRDGLHQLIGWAIGRILTRVSLSAVQSSGGVVPARIEIVSSDCRALGANSWAEYLQKITDNADRNALLIDLAATSSSTCPTLLLTERVQHAKTLAALVSGRGIDAVLAHGQMPTKERQAAMQEMFEASLTIGTTGLLGEGLDVSNWGALILATPISGRVRLLQAIGRVIRPHTQKSHGRVIDLVDDNGFSQASLKKRLRIYRERGYQIERNRRAAA